MKKYGNIIIIILLTIVILLYFFDYHKNSQEIFGKIDSLTNVIEIKKEFEDSLLLELQNIEIIDTEKVNNYYEIKYEKEASIIRGNNVNSDIEFFSTWYYSR